MIPFIYLSLNLGAVFSLPVIIFLLIFLWSKNKVSVYIARRALVFSFVAAAIATSGSLFFSQFIGLVPCALCWFQRIFMYSQAVILGMALVRRDKKIMEYTLVLSIIGWFIAAYQYGLNWYAYFYPKNAVCPLTGTADCAIESFQWGFVNIPFMSLCVFTVLILLNCYYHRYGTSATHGHKKNT